MRLGRSNSQRVRGEKQPEVISTSRLDAFVSIDEAVQEHRKPVSKRPSTSAGVEERRKRSSSKTSMTAKQAVREPTCFDDLEKIGRTVDYTDGLDTFRFPTPEPRAPSPSPLMPRSATFQPVQQSQSPLKYQPPKIGVAIGSPSNVPPNWGRSYTTNNMVDLIRSNPPSQAPTRPPAPQRSQTAIVSSPEARKKKSSWKGFSSLFRRSSKRRTQTSMYQCMPAQQTNAPVAARRPPIQELQSSEATSPVLPSPRPISRTRGHSRAPSTTDRQTSSAMPTPTGRTSHVPNLRYRIRGSLTPSPRITPTRASPDIFRSASPDPPHDSPMQDSGHLQSKPIPRTPRLDMEIPKSEFERYSVMFEKLLSNESRPSLLERRQSRLQQRRSGYRASEDTNTPPPVPSGEMPSMHLTRSLSIQTGSKKSIEASSQSASHFRPRPVQRSRTAPPGSVSPVTTAFSRKTTLESSPDSFDTDTLYSENSLPPTPTTITTCTDTESLRGVLDQKEPAWDELRSQHAPPPSIKILSSPTRTNTSSDTDEPYPRVKSPEDLERQIVQVSVARQVSVTRAKMRVQKAVATKQPLRPRVVELVKNRKSTVGVLESAWDDDQDGEGVPEVPAVGRSGVIEGEEKK